MSNESEESVTTEEALDRYEDSDESHPPTGSGEAGPTMSSESIRLPQHVIDYYETQAEKRGLGKTTMMRVALMEWMESKQNEQLLTSSNPSQESAPEDNPRTEDNAPQSTSNQETFSEPQQDEETPGTARA